MRSSACHRHVVSHQRRCGKIQGVWKASISQPCIYAKSQQKGELRLALENGRRCAPRKRNTLCLTEPNFPCLTHWHSRGPPLTSSAVSSSSSSSGWYSSSEESSSSRWMSTNWGGYAGTIIEKKWRGNINQMDLESKGRKGRARAGEKILRAQWAKASNKKQGLKRFLARESNLRVTEWKTQSLSFKS